ncbi:MAG TPA: hypothetical protein VGK19_26040 [Capsulimonadaceae bacterium]|jgi:hypothetical protein
MKRTFNTFTLRFASCFFGLATMLVACSADALPDLPPGVAPARALVLGASVSGSTAAVAAGARYVAPVRVSVNGAAVTTPAKDGLAIAHTGYNDSTASLSYVLPAGATGTYEIWTAFNLGGVAKQSFKLSAGGSDTATSERVSWEQSNDVSWKLDWRKADGRVTLYPQDKALTIDESGKASGHKVLVAVVLSRVADLPAGMDERGGASRAAMEAWRPKAVTRRVYLLESALAIEADPLLRVIDARAEGLKSSTVASIFSSDEARQMVAAVGGGTLPALVVMDEAYTVLAVRRPSDGAKRIESALAATVPLDVVNPAASTARIAGEAMVDGAPVAWLVAGTWAGPSGLSLWGLDAESEARPNVSDPCIVEQFDTVLHSKWEARQVDGAKTAVISTSTGDFVWSRGTAYAFAYVNAAAERDVVLHLSQSGIQSAVWVNGRPAVFAADKSAAALSLAVRGGTDTTASITDQGGTVLVQPAHNEGAVSARMHLAAGWNRVLVKLTMQNGKGEAFLFRARFTEANGDAATGLRTALSDPQASTSLHAEAVRVQPLVTTDAPFNMAYAGKPLKLHVALKRLASADEPSPVVPLVPFRGKLSVTLKDYDGKIVAERPTSVVFPGSADIDLGAAPPTGYYSVHLALATVEGAPIVTFQPDGFSVIAGIASQKARAASKKMATTYYWMNDGKASSFYFPYMERLGIYRNIGGNPGPNVDLYGEANRRGLRLAGDLWYFEGPSVAESVTKLAPFVDTFKSFNEVDIVPHVRGTAEHWTTVTKAHYEAVKQVAPKATVLSASLVRPGANSWFKECLTLGMDKYVDIWDVHCYPRDAPTLGGSMSNSQNETELGVLKSYKELGRVNDKPFWIGETGARACHGADARRWQADMVAKMTATANSRDDFQKIGFLVPWWYSREHSSLGDIETGHMPGEAAYYTASALIDGFPYTRLDVGAGVQAARFGPTTMLWAPSGKQPVTLTLAAGKKWVLVDVVGRKTSLAVDAGGKAMVTATTSPVYVLEGGEYARLTGF